MEAMRIHREPLFDRDDRWQGLILHVTGRQRPSLRVRTAAHRILLEQNGAVIWEGELHPDHGGVDFQRTGEFRSPLPPIRASQARSIGADPSRWSYWIAACLAEQDAGPLHDGRWILKPLDRLGFPVGPQGKRNPGKTPAQIVQGDEEGFIDWWDHHSLHDVMPMRPMPHADEGRVKAYRKLARANALPPVLLWWISGLDGYAVLDGHARLAAAMAEGMDPPMIEAKRLLNAAELEVSTMSTIEDYESDIARLDNIREQQGTVMPAAESLAGPTFSRRLESLTTHESPTTAWPLDEAFGETLQEPG